MKGLSLFANVGIAETYLASTGIDIVVANELLAQRCRRYSEMYPDCQMICGDITDPYIYQTVYQQSLKHKVDFVIATPPCQGMSIAGKMQHDDPRNILIVKAIDMIQDLGVHHRIIENVPHFFKTYLLVNNQKILIPDYIRQRFGNQYHITFQVLDTADYGTPQHRKRAIVLGSSKSKRLPPPPKAHITVHQAIGHLPSLEAGQKSNIAYHHAPRHNANHIVWMKHTPSGQTAFDNLIHYPNKNGRPIKGFRTTYKRIDRNKPAPTITMANGSISSQNNVHPGRILSDGTYSDARVLTLQEIFILTGLSHTWKPPTWASESLIRKVIGEGIPPKLIVSLVQTMPH